MGTVVDASTHEALPYVQIIVKGTTVGTTTDANGAFILPNLRPGTYILEARLLGYALESSGVAVQAGHGRHHDFYLRQQAIDLDGVVISANRHETMRRSAPSLVTVLSQEIFQKTHSDNLSQGLRFQPGLRIEDVRTVGSTKYVSTDSRVPIRRSSSIVAPYSVHWQEYMVWSRSLRL